MKWESSSHRGGFSLLSVDNTSLRITEISVDTHYWHTLITRQSHYKPISLQTNGVTVVRRASQGVTPCSLITVTIHRWLNQVFAMISGQNTVASWTLYMLLFTVP